VDNVKKGKCKSVKKLLQTYPKGIMSKHNIKCMKENVTSRPIVIGILSDERVRGRVFKEFIYEGEYYMMQCS
jgi:hypothetical protein